MWQWFKVSMGVCVCIWCWETGSFFTWPVTCGWIWEAWCFSLTCNKNFQVLVSTFEHYRLLLHPQRSHISKSTSWQTNDLSQYLWHYLKLQNITNIPPHPYLLPINSLPTFILRKTAEDRISILITKIKVLRNRTQIWVPYVKSDQC